MTKTSTITLTSALLCSLFLGFAANAKPLNDEQRSAVKHHFDLLEQVQTDNEQAFVDAMNNRMDKKLKRQESALVANICTEHGGDYDDTTGTCTGIR